MQVEYDGETYDVDLDDMDLAEARHIKRKTGLDIKGLYDGFMSLDPEALAALYWYMMKRRGKGVDIHSVNFKIAKFGAALIDAYVRENPAGEGEEGDDPKDETSTPE